MAQHPPSKRTAPADDGHDSRLQRRREARETYDSGRKNEKPRGEPSQRERDQRSRSPRRERSPRKDRDSRRERSRERPRGHAREGRTSDRDTGRERERERERRPPAVTKAAPQDEVHNAPAPSAQPKKLDASPKAAEEPEKPMTKTKMKRLEKVKKAKKRDEDSMDVDVGWAEEDFEAAMMKVMGFRSFKTTQNTKVPGNDKLYGVRKEKKTEYRQYMNRVGGFNRPLSPSRDAL